MNPEKIGTYSVTEEILPAGLGRLYLATDPQQDGPFALRQLPTSYFKDPAWRASFLEQMGALADCGHPGIIPSSLMEIDGQDWLVRPWLPGGTLADWLARGPLAPELAVSIINQVAAALDAAHACGVLYLNLKPANILFNKNGAACLADFAPRRAASSGNLGALNWLEGAAGSISPEAALGSAGLDARSDVYSLGALAFEMLSAQPPFPTHSILEAALYHLNSPLPDLKALRPDLSSGLVLTIQRALAKDPAMRFASAKEFASALNWAFQNPRKTPSWVKTMPDLHPKPQRAPRRRFGRAFAGVSFTLFAAAAVLFFSGAFGRVLPGLDLPAINRLIPFAQTSPTATLDEAILAPSATLHVSLETQLPPGPTASLTPEPPTLTFTPRPTLTPLPSATATPTPPVIGGANLLAFINDNDIWTVYLNGDNLTRITSDEQPKTDLQWTPDGKGLTYSSNGCYYLLVYATLETGRLGCYEDLEISPDMQRFIIGGTVRLPNKNNSWMNFTGPLDYPYLRSLSVVPQTSTSRGIAFIGGRLNRFSPYSDLMAAVFKAPLDGRQVDVVQVFRLFENGTFDVLDTFPSRRFQLSGYSALKDEPVLDDFGWDGESLFTLHGDILHGYGDLVLYNMDTGRAETLNPIAGKCCYQDIQFSPDGQYLLFAFQDNTIGEGAQIYLIAVGTIGSGAAYTPIELPYYFFGDARARLEPALRPAGE